MNVVGSLYGFRIYFGYMLSSILVLTSNIASSSRRSSILAIQTLFTNLSSLMRRRCSPLFPFFIPILVTLIIHLHPTLTHIAPESISHPTVICCIAICGFRICVPMKIVQTSVPYICSCVKL